MNDTNEYYININNVFRRYNFSSFVLLVYYMINRDINTNNIDIR